MYQDASKHYATKRKRVFAIFLSSGFVLSKLAIKMLMKTYTAPIHRKWRYIMFYLCSMHSHFIHKVKYILFLPTYLYKYITLNLLYYTPQLNAQSCIIVIYIIQHNHNVYQQLCHFFDAYKMIMCNMCINT